LTLERARTRKIFSIQVRFHAILLYCFDINYIVFL